MAIDDPTTLYVTHQGARLHRAGERVQVRDERGHVLKDLPLFRLERVVILGTIEVTNATLSHFFRQGIDLVFLTQDGRFKGRLGALGLADARVRLAQYRLGVDPAAGLAVARRIVEAKVRNGRVLLMRRQRSLGKDLAREIQGMALLLARIPTAASIDELMGLEGACARQHFDAFRTLLAQDLGFEKRVRRPPTDPVNAMLSFGYTLLFGHVLAAVKAAGLDPYLGSLHAIDPGRPSLALDLMEELRPVVVDPVVLNMVNRVELTVRDFTRGEAGAVSMSPPALARLVKSFQARLEDPIHHPASERSMPLRDAISRQALHYRDMVTQKAPVYLPMEVR